MDDRILDKIKKCLALGDSPEPHEAAAAMRQAQKLMDMHGISMQDIKGSDIGEASLSSVVSVSVVNKWELHLVHMIVRAFGCQVMWNKSNSHAADVYGKFTFVGLKQQVQLAVYTAQVLQRRIVKARAAYQRSLPEWQSRKTKTTNADTFAIGWIQSVKKTVHEFANPAGVDELIKIRYNGLCRSDKKAPVKKRDKGDYASLLAGQAAGAGESIHRPMRGSPSQLRIGA